MGKKIGMVTRIMDSRSGEHAQDEVDQDDHQHDDKLGHGKGLYERTDGMGDAGHGEQGAEDVGAGQQQEHHGRPGGRRP